MAGNEFERNPELKRMEQEYQAEIDFLMAATVTEETSKARQDTGAAAPIPLRSVFLGRREVLATAQILISKLEEQGIDAAIQVAFALAQLGQKTAEWEWENPEEDKVPVGMPKFPQGLKRLIEEDDSQIENPREQIRIDEVRGKFEASCDHAKKLRPFLSDIEARELELAVEKAMAFILDTEE